MRLLALIEHTSIVARILRYLGLRTDRPEPRPARASPHYAFDLDSQLSMARRNVLTALVVGASLTVSCADRTIASAMEGLDLR